ncbi:MAG: hypothetical protein RL481_2412, partial [Pseudomonadota bacterium]
MMMTGLALAMAMNMAAMARD